MDKRRRQYVPLASQIAFTKSGTKLLDKWGMEGLCTWMLYLAACKREFVQGVFAYTSEAEAWGKLGAESSSFTVEEFFKYTGSQKMTSRRRDGRITHVTCTHWKDWNDEYSTQLKAEKKSSKQATNMGTLPGESGEKAPTDSELESDSEKTVAAANGNGSRKRDELWDELTTILGHSPSTSPERGRWNKALKDLRGAGATPDEMRRRSIEYRKRYPTTTLTPTALSANWGALGPAVNTATWRCNLCPVTFTTQMKLSDHLRNVHHEF